MSDKKVTSEAQVILDEIMLNLLKSKKGAQELEKLINGMDGLKDAIENAMNAAHKANYVLMIAGQSRQ